MEKKKYPTTEQWRISASFRITGDNYQIFNAHADAREKFEELRRSWSMEEGEPTCEYEEGIIFRDDESYCEWEWEDHFTCMRLTHIPSFASEIDEQIWKIKDACRESYEGLMEYIVTSEDSDSVRGPLSMLGKTADELETGLKEFKKNCPQKNVLANFLENDPEKLCDLDEYLENQKKTADSVVEMLIIQKTGSGFSYRKFCPYRTYYHEGVMYTEWDFLDNSLSVDQCRNFTMQELIPIREVHHWTEKEVKELGRWYAGVREGKLQ